jgi:hypothetical protein
MVDPSDGRPKHYTRGGVASTERWRRRLGRVRSALAAEPDARSFATGLVPLRLNGKGFQPDVSALERAIEEAARGRDFRRAAALQDLLFVASPKPALTVDDCAPAGAEAAASFFVQNGFVCVRELFPPPLLKRIQSAWRRAQAKARTTWEEAKAMGHGGNAIFFENQQEIDAALAARRTDWTDAGSLAMLQSAPDRALPHGRLFFDIPVEDLFAEALTEGANAALLDVIDPPKLMDVLEHIVGDDALLSGVQARTVPPENEAGYTSVSRFRLAAAAAAAAFATPQKES